MHQRGFVGGLKLATCPQLHSVECTQQHICCVCVYQGCCRGSLSWLPCPHQPAWRYSAAGGHSPPGIRLGATRHPPARQCRCPGGCGGPGVWHHLQLRSRSGAACNSFARQLQPDPAVAVLACICAGLDSLLAHSCCCSEIAEAEAAVSVTQLLGLDSYAHIDGLELQLHPGSSLQDALVSVCCCYSSSP